MIDLLAFTPLIPAFLYLYILGYVNAQKRKSHLHRTFFLFFSNLLLMMLVQFAVYMPLPPTALIIFNKTLVILFLLTGIVFLYFVFAISGQRTGTLFRIMAICSLSCAAVSIFLDTATTIPVANSFTRVSITKPPLAPLMIIADLGPGIFAMILCFKSMRRLPDKNSRRQVALLFWGTVFSTIFAVVIIGLGQYAFNVVVTSRISCLGIAIQALFVFRAVTRYQFLSVDIQQVEAVSRLLFDHVREGVVLLDSKGLPVQMNMAARTILSLEGLETAKLNLGGLFAGYSTHQMYEERRLTIKLNKQERILLVSQYPIEHPHATLGMIVLMRDITGQTKLEAELSKARQLESLGILAGGIAHDFNNFLTSITATFVLVKVSVASDPQLVEIVSDGEAAALKAARLTQQLVTFAKGGVPIKESVPVRTLIEETIRFSLRGSATSFTLDMVEGVWPVNADKEQLSQVFHNLAINAVQAMPGGGTIAITVRNRILTPGERAPLDPGNYVEIRMRDNGSGIPPEIIGNIFDPYFTTKSTGNGLGLTTVYSIMKRHGGHIFVSSKPGAGTEMTLYIPASATPQPMRTEHPIPPPLFSGSGRILVMDDEPTVLATLSRLLESMGFTVEKATNGEEAIRLYDSPGRGNGYYRCIIADLTVPGGQGGKELAQKLIEREPGLRIVVSSGYSNDPIVANYRDYGFCGTLKKPYDITALSDMLKHVLS